MRNIKCLVVLAWLVLAIIPLYGGEGIYDLASLRPLLGKWEGTGKGFGGTATVTRTCRPLMKGTYIMSRTRAEFAPTQEKPGGDSHQDVGFFSVDKPGKRVMYREFNSEGFVNTYVLKSVSDNGRTFIFETIEVEGMADGWLARLTVTLKNRDEMEEKFELAAPGKEYATCGTNTFKRSTEMRKKRPADSTKH